MALVALFEERLAALERNLAARMDARMDAMDARLGEAGRVLPPLPPPAPAAEVQQPSNLHRQQLLSALDAPWDCPSQVEAACADRRKCQALEAFTSLYVERPPKFWDSLLGQLFMTPLLGHLMVKGGG